VLKFPNFTKPFEVYTDANGSIIGWVFMHDGHLVTFESKKLCVKDTKIYKNKGLRKCLNLTFKQ
jgi:hypothetical protein